MQKYYLNIEIPLKLASEKIIKEYNVKFFSEKEIYFICFMFNQKFMEKLWKYGHTIICTDVLQDKEGYVNYYIEYKFNNQTDEILYLLEN
jgi:mRNA degradation ribonuclease J1/J2